MAERILVAINASGDHYTAYHGDLNGTVTELLSGNVVTLTGQFDMAPYSVNYLKF